jgi:8-oxo-dGTP diphosphatase
VTRRATTDRALVPVVGAAILRGDRCLATQRSAAMSMPLLWEFPGGKVETGESPQAALRRELAEELGIDVEVTHLLATGESQVEHRTIRLDVYLARMLADQQPVAHQHRALGWFTADELMALEWPDADRPAVAKVCELLRARSKTRAAGADGERGT